MKTRILILIPIVIIIAILVFLLTSDQYYLSLQDQEIKKSDWVKNCVPPESHQAVPSIGLYNHTHSFDLLTCTWHSTEHGAPGFLESLYTSFIEPIFLGVADSFEIEYAYAGCSATIIPQPCFDAFMGSTEPMTQKSIMESFARTIEANYDDWEPGDRKWDNFDKKLNLPVIICTEFVADGMTQYRMAKWVDTSKISSFENHRNDWMCNTWLPPVDDGVKIRWNKPTFLPNDVGVVTVTAKEMNHDDVKLDSFIIHVWSDVDHAGIQTTVTETDVDSGVFEETIFFTPEGKSNGTRLLVEDAVYAEYKFSINSARINDKNNVALDESHTTNSENTQNPNECWVQDNDGNLLPCKIDDGGYGMVIGLFLVVFWPYVVLGIGILGIYIIWRKRK